jgi:dihydroorotate dehydrogenase
MRIFPVFRPLIHQLDPEAAHRLTVRGLAMLPIPAAPPCDPALAVELAGLRFPNPVGLAAGFDKDAEVPDRMLALGFGLVEVGTLTPLPQSGNPKPRLFRLAQDHAVINRMGFNNGGQAAAAVRLGRRARRGIVGINIGANKDSPDRIADYAAGVRAMAPFADYLTINISSPNTPGLRSLQQGEALSELLDVAREARTGGHPPLFLKVAPDLDPTDIDAIVRAALGKVDALIVANTTIARPPLRSPQREEAGGLSGAPLRALALQRLRDFRSASGASIPLIGVGGIASAEDAWARIRAGATLIQLYSALVYEGPGLARRITRGLIAIMRREGFASVAAAVGTETA